MDDHIATSVTDALSRRPSPAGLDATALLMAAPEALVAVQGGVIVFANHRAQQLLGAAGTGLHGHQLTDHLPAFSPAGGVAVEQTAVRADGARIHVEVRDVVLDDGTALLAFWDAGGLEAARMAEAARDEAQARYQALIEQLPAVAYIDKEGKGTIYASPQIETILGVTADEYCADPDLWRRLLHPDDRERIEGQYAAFLAGHGDDLMDYRMVTPDGRVVRIRDRAQSVRDADGRVLLEHGLMFDITELKEAEAQIAHLAYHDKLTGLPNRASFEDRLEHAVEHAAGDGTAVGVVYLDLDNFKLVNDSLGHQAGDQLLQQLAGRLRDITRDVDLVARQGGDEFLLLLTDLATDLSGGPDPAVVNAEAVAIRIADALKPAFDLSGVDFYARGSVGVSLYPHDATNAEDLMKNADSAMYRAKRTNPGGHAFFRADENPTARLAFATQLRRAVEHEQWVLHYQPLIDLADGRMTGAEALVRWEDPGAGLVAPGEFIPVAEELGLIEAIGEWVLDDMATQQRAWMDAGLDLELSFNLSPRELWSPQLAERILKRLHDARVPPTSVVVEITESTAMSDPDRTLRLLAELRSWGLRLALDDFGTGYSSLARLKHMPVDVLKIDQAFVRDVDRDVRLARMVRAMIQLAHSLDMLPLAEGVETVGEYHFLRANGCRFAQGFLFSRPVAAEQIAELATRPGGLAPID